MSFSYSNPVWSGYCADPFVLQHGDFYYCYGTGETGDARRFVLLRSRDLIHWEHLGGALEVPAGHEDASFWAPEVCFANGKFRMYFSFNVQSDETTHRLHVAVSDSPAGPFQTVCPLLVDETFSIDASPFHDPRSGKWFLYFARDYFEGRIGTGTAVVELGDDMISVVGEPIPVILASADWQIYERNRSIYDRIVEAWHTVEGPFVVFRDETYWCFYSGGNWQNDTYGAGYAVADSPLGPWRDEWSSGGASVLRGSEDVIGPGHCSVVTAPDGETLVCVYHAWNTERTMRQLCIAPIEWTNDGPKVTLTRSGGRLG